MSSDVRDDARRRHHFGTLGLFNDEDADLHEVDSNPECSDQVIFDEFDEVNEAVNENTTNHGDFKIAATQMSEEMSSHSERSDKLIKRQSSAFSEIISNDNISNSLVANERYQNAAPEIGGLSKPSIEEFVGGSSRAVSSKSIDKEIREFFRTCGGQHNGVVRYEDLKDGLKDHGFKEKEVRISINCVRRDRPY